MKLTEAMANYVRDLRRHRADPSQPHPSDRVMGRSQSGGYTRVTRGLRLRGLLDGDNELTPEGRKVADQLLADAAPRDIGRKGATVPHWREAPGVNVEAVERVKLTCPLKINHDVKRAVEADGFKLVWTSPHYSDGRKILMIFERPMTQAPEERDAAKAGDITVYRVRRLSDGMYLGARAWGQTHSHTGKVYATRGHANDACKGGCLKRDDHRVITYTLRQVRSDNLTP